MASRAFDPKAKAKRQKIVAAVGGVILVILLVWRVPPMIAMMNEKAPPPPTPAAPAPVTPGAPVPPSVPPASGGQGGELIDTDPAPVAGPGQLVSFGRFVSKDPFVQQSEKRCTDSAGVAITCPPAKPPPPPKAPAEEPGSKPGSPPSGEPTTPAERESAQISVNGATEGVSVNATFPTSDPVFRLVSVASKTAKIAIDGGSYASGDATITLEKGKPVTLVNTADGTRYRVVLVGTG
jgi:hypothetical protein